MTMQKKIRCKTQCGMSVKWRLGQARDGKWKAMGLSDAKMGSRPVPLDFVPFELSNAVINGPSFDTIDQAEAFVRSL